MPTPSFFGKSRGTKTERKKRKNTVPVRTSVLYCLQSAPAGSRQALRERA